MSEAEIRRPLEGLRVLDLGHVYQVPYAGFLLAMAGADVVKVEPPDGEPLRARILVSGGASYPMIMLNASKRSIAIDLKRAEGRALFLELVAQADVLLENFSPGVMAKLGLGADTLLEINPRLIYASGTGYGLSGPDRDALAMDLTIQATSGMMGSTGEADRMPLKAGPAITDFLSGTHVYGGIMTALYDRERTGKGTKVEVAMIEAAFPALASNLGVYYGDRSKTQPRNGNHHGGNAIAPYTVFETNDGYVAIICVTDRHWDHLTVAMGREELMRDERFKDNKSRVAHIDQTDAIVAEWTGKLSRHEVMEIAREFRFPAAPVRGLDEVVADAHMHARGAIFDIEHPQLGTIALTSSPIRLGNIPPLHASDLSELDADRDAIIAEWLGR
ncbi:MAG: CaiB/BaiF CoA transferase family protein [Alphaproteobacteria bacterium]